MANMIARILVLFLLGFQGGGALASVQGAVALSPLNAYYGFKSSARWAFIQSEGMLKGALSFHDRVNDVGILGQSELVFLDTETRGANPVLRQCERFKQEPGVAIHSIEQGCLRVQQKNGKKLYSAYFFDRPKLRGRPLSVSVSYSMNFLRATGLDLDQAKLILQSLRTHIRQY